MNYLVAKKASDQRHSICGVMVLEGGFFTVIGLTMDNQQQLRNIMDKPNYTVTKTDLPEGFYAPNGCRVTEDSVWDFHLYSGPLVYIDNVPAGLDAEVQAHKSDVRPPNVMDRPTYVNLQDMPEVSDEDLPEAVRLARQRVSQESVAVAPKANKIESAIPIEDDATTLGAADNEDDAVAMLRAQLDVRGIPYSNQAKAPALQKKLNEATA